MTPTSPRLLRSVLVVLTVVLGLAACGGHGVEEIDLLSAAPPPDVLTERAVVALPTSGAGTRFVRGWRFAGAAGGVAISPDGDDSVVEVVRLRQHLRTLTLETAAAPDGGSSTVTATCAGRRLGTYPVTTRTAVPLPLDLALGRVAIGLRFSDPEAVVLRRATVRPRARPGAVEIADGAISQTGFSALELALMAEPGSEVAGTLVPPSGARPDQRFSLTVEGDGARTLLVWSASEGSTEMVPFGADLVRGSHPQVVRIRLLAQGAGPPAVWRGLVLRRPRPAPSPKPAPPPPPPKLVVLYVLDALRADALGAFGGRPDVTPVLDRLANEGVAFARHFSAAPNTAPSTKALFTGHTFLSGGALSADGPETLAEAFAHAGYRTAAVTANPYFARELGLGRGFEDVQVLPIAEDFRPDAPPTVNDSAERVDRAALEWLDRLDDDDRAFLYIHSLNPHNPYTPPPPFAGRFSSAAASWLDGSTATLVSIRDGKRPLRAAEAGRLRGLYLDGVSYNDDQIGILLDRLRSRYRDRDILLVVTADHGEELSDHGGLFHGHTLYDEVVHIPLVISWPGLVRPRRVERLTDTLELHQTLAALVAPDSVTAGPSLWPDLLGTRPPPSDAGRIVFAAAPGLRHGYMARSNRWKVILAHRRGLDFGMGRGPGRTHDPEYVFDLEHDPGEHHNVAGAAVPEVAWLRAKLEAWVDAHREQQASAPFHLDAATRRRLEALGYRE